MPRKDKRRVPKNLGVDDDDAESISSDLTDPSVTSEDGGLQLESATYEEKFGEAMELAQGKSVASRVNALISMKVGLQKKIITDFLTQNHQSITDIIERSLRKGKGAEQAAAAKLAMVLVINLQSSPEAQEIFKTLYQTLVTVVKDPSASLAARKEVASALALLAFLACPDPSDLPTILNTLHNVFCGSLPKGNGELPTLSAGMFELHCAALSGVCLLMTLLSATTVYTMAQKMLEELTPVLDTPDTDLRIAVGEALALIHESAKRHDEDFKWRHQRRVIERLEKFVSDSHKYQGKKDRKLQRFSFREIIHTISEGEPLNVTINIGPSQFREELYIDSWALRFQYQALCHALEEGLSYHMSYNSMIRNIFDLGPPQQLAELRIAAAKIPKRPNRQTPQAKARNLSRNKNRDNRQNALEYED